LLPTQFFASRPVQIIFRSHYVASTTEYDDTLLDRMKSKFLCKMYANNYAWDNRVGKIKKYNRIPFFLAYFGYGYDERATFVSRFHMSCFPCRYRVKGVYCVTNSEAPYCSKTNPKGSPYCCAPAVPDAGYMLDLTDQLGLEENN
jgi:hypothetical protein